MIRECAFSVAPECIEAITRTVADHGALGVETGAYLLASMDDPAYASVAALTGNAGVGRHPLLLTISASANDRLFTWAVAQGLTIVSYVHSHKHSAFLSRTDREESLNVEGFVAAVIPFFEDPRADVSAWGWWRFTQGEWVPVLAARPRRCGSARVIVFDETGVRES